MLDGTMPFLRGGEGHRRGATSDLEGIGGIVYSEGLCMRGLLCLQWGIELLLVEIHLH